MLEEKESEHSSPNSKKEDCGISGNSVEVYKQLCSQNNCKPNSGFILYLQDRGCSLALVRLTLSSNYLGPKGLIPVICLIDKCQTLTHVDLENNGADNASVDFLCDTLERHIGVTWVSLRSNPITPSGGKRILRLVEANSRITHMDVSETFIYEAVQHAIYCTAERNEAVHRNGTELVPLDPMTKAYAKKVVESLQKKKEHVIIEPVTLPRSNSNEVVSTHSVSGGGKLPLIHAAAGEDAEGGTITCIGDENENLNAQQSKRMPVEQLKNLRNKFFERAALYQDLQKSELSNYAKDSRLELMMLEKNFGLVPSLPKSSKSTFAEARRKREDSPTKVADLIEECPSDWSPEEAKTTVTEQIDNDAAVSVSKSAMEDEKALREEKARGEESPSVEEAMFPSERLLLSTEEQFQSLFDQGCREYQHRQLERAYVAWNGAMRIAVRQANREWISVLKMNLQYVTYEIFVDDGTQKLEDGLFKEADHCFERALQIAMKTKNAEWETAMVTARQSVRRAFFFRHHTAARALLSEARKVEFHEATEDDYYIVPCIESDRTDDRDETKNAIDEVHELKVLHSSAFVNEWPKIFLVREAIGKWAEAGKALRKFDTLAQEELSEVLNDALNEVAMFLIELHCTHTEPLYAVSWMGCSRFTYHEAIKLSELYVDMVGYNQQYLKHDLLYCIVGLYLGNLALATNDLTKADQNFRTALQFSKKMSVGTLEAAALTYSATVNVQRGNYAVAERELLEARQHWIEAMQYTSTAIDAAQPTEGETDTIATQNASTEPLVTAPGDLVHYTSASDAVRSALPPRFSNWMSNAGNMQLVTILASTFRYQESLEMLEYALMYHSHDLLFEKMQVNFSHQPTLGELISTAKVLRTNLVYYCLSHRSTWSVEEYRYQVEESLLMWIVPRGGKMRFVELNVLKEHHTTIEELVREAREGMRVDPLPTDGVTEITHREAWISRLERLHAIFFDPIVSYIRSLELSFDSCENSVVTIIPTGVLWAVPFNALVNRQGQYAIEEFGIQLSFCATQAHFSTVSAEQVRKRNLQRRVVVQQPQVPTELGEDQNLRAPGPEPCDYIRSCKEAEKIVETIRNERLAGSQMELQKEKNAFDTTSRPNQDVVVPPLEEIVEDLPNTVAAMREARSVHFAVKSSFGQQRSVVDGSVGELHLAMYATEDTPAHMGSLSASQISHMELFPDVVSMSNTKIAVGANGLLVEDTLGLARAFLCAGAPCVVVGQWCTPDSHPALVFSEFYRRVCHHDYISAALARSSDPFKPGVAHSSSFRNGVEEAALPSFVRAAVDGTSPMPPLRDKDRHKALYLAESLRELIKDPDMRFCPRTWAGYYSVGSGFF